MIYERKSKNKNDKVRIYPTLRCNINCSYCVNNIDGKREYGEIEAKEWIPMLNSLGMTVIITGGEPTLYSGLYELIAGLNVKVCIYTNGTFDVAEFMQNVHKKIDIVMSNHIDENDFHDKVAALKTAHKVIVKKITPEKNQWNVYSEYYNQRYEDEDWVRCERDNILIGPDGRRYPCVSKLVRGVDALEDLKKEPLNGMKTEVDCAEFGQCAPCDFLGGVKINEYTHTENTTI